uniref:Uncharacterized protein n=3 Tax=Sus scrofa TaxID=9823 RepID=A0A8D1IKM9_PIG
MAQIYLVMAGVMLCSISVCFLDQNLSAVHCVEKREIFKHLQEMKKIPSQLCVKDRIDFKFPWKRESITQIQKTEGTCYCYLMLQQISSVFSKKDSRAAWNTTLLDQLLSSLDLGLRRLEHMKKDNMDCPHVGSALRKYFQGIQLYLKEKKYSPCAWEIVRVEIERCFSLT